MLAKGPDGAVNYQESFQRAENARQHLERRLGAGDIPPAKPEDYVFTPPAEMADFKLDDTAAAAFKAKAHKWGMTQAQYEGVMGEYMALVPSLMQGGARLSAAAATEELKKVWQEPAVFQRGLADAGKATSALPADLQSALQEFGTNPAVLRALAYFGAEMRDPVPPNGGVPPGGGGFDPYSPEVVAIVNNPRHPRQAEVAKARQQYFEAKAAAAKA